MIFEIRIPDEVFESYDKSPQKIANRVIETAGMELNPKTIQFYFSAKQIADLRRHFGPNIKDADALIARILAVGTIKLQTAAFQLDSDQIDALKNQAYFYAEDGEPRDHNEEGFTKAQHKTVIQRYTETILKEATTYILGLC